MTRRSQPGLQRGPLVVIGDSLLDVDLDGTSERQCPDAPAPVIDVDRRRLRPGGAGLAALLAAQDGTPVQLITGLGRDDAADTLLRLLNGIDVLPQPLRGSTVIKTRIRLGDAPLARVDSGDGRSGADPLTTAAAEAIDQAGAILVADYGRGLAWQPELRARLAARSPEVPLVWDPHPRGARPVPGATLVTPNAAEAEPITPGAPNEHARGRQLCRAWSAAAAAITLGADGAVLTRDGAPASHRIPVPAALLAGPGSDTCGAGDRFAAAAAEALRQGRSTEASVQHAVAAAACFVRAGAASAHSRLHHTHGPVVPIASPVSDADTLIARTRRAGGVIVATGGCFDLLHRAHVTLLERARELGDLLVVCLNSDASVRRAKGPGRPVVGEQDRARVLASLAAVDAVVVFDEDTPAAVLDRLRPDIWVKGGDYADRQLPESEVVTRHGGRIVLLPMLDGYSTSSLIAAAVPVAV